MTSTVEFLDAVKARRGGISDYALAPILGITRAQVSKMRVGKDFLSDRTALKVAELLEMEPAAVVASAHAERAKTPEEKTFWASIYQRFGSGRPGPNCGADAVRS